MAEIKTGILGSLFGVLSTILVWTFLAGGQQAKTAERLDDHERRIARIEQIQSDLAEIKATLKAMQAEQRILHGQAGLGR